jgi:dGTPase
VRVLDVIFPYNITLQTLSGIAGHDGESEQNEYRPHPLAGFDEFDALIEGTYLDRGRLRHLHPSTPEGCAVRIADIIAYLGKDRQDAARARIAGEGDFAPLLIGSRNAEIIHNMIVNIIENSYGTGAIRMDAEHFEALAIAKRENYERIYGVSEVNEGLNREMSELFEHLYESVYADLASKNMRAPVFRHHIAHVTSWNERYMGTYDWESDLDRTVVDYIASMTDDYFMAFARHVDPNAQRLFPRREHF